MFIICYFWRSLPMLVPCPQPCHSGSQNTTCFSYPKKPLRKSEHWPSWTTALTSWGLVRALCAQQSWQDAQGNRAPAGPATWATCLPDDRILCFQLTFMSPFLCPDTMSAPPQTPAHFFHQSALAGSASHPHQRAPEEGHKVPRVKNLSMWHS